MRFLKLIKLNGYYVICLFFILSSEVQAQDNLLQNPSFELACDELCDLTSSGGVFFQECISHWKNYNGSPSAHNQNSCAHFDGSSSYPAAHLDNYVGLLNGSGIFQEGIFSPGTYYISFQYMRGELALLSIPATIKVGFQNGLINVPTDDPSNLNVSGVSVVNLDQINATINTGWWTYEAYFQLESTYEDFVLYSQYIPGLQANRLSDGNTALVDNLILRRVSDIACPVSSATTAEELFGGAPFDLGVAGTMETLTNCELEDQCTQVSDTIIEQFPVFLGTIAEAGAFDIEFQTDLLTNYMESIINEAPICDISGEPMHPINVDYVYEVITNESVSVIALVDYACCQICDVNDTPNFTIESYCDDGNWCVTGFAQDSNTPSHWWGLMEISNFSDPINTSDSNTSDSNTVDSDGDSSNGITPLQLITSQDDFAFCGLDQSKNYYIKHGIWNEDCYEWREVRTPVAYAAEGVSAFHFEDAEGNMQSEFCYGEDIYLDGTGSENYDRFFIDAKRRPVGSSSNDPFEYYANYGWTISNTIGILNLSDEFLNHGEDPGEVFEPGFEYQIKLAIQNVSTCVPWTLTEQEFRVICCDDSLDASFTTNEQGNQDDYIIRPSDVEVYGPDVQHEWYIGQTITIDDPLLSVDLISNESNFTYHADYGPFYYIFHKIITPCGEFCYGYRTHRDNGSAQGRSHSSCDLCGPIDCSEIPDGDDSSITDVVVSPNPNNGNMTIAVYGTGGTSFTTSIYNYNGVLVTSLPQVYIEDEVAHVNYEGQGSLPNGMYFIVITTSGQETITRQVFVRQ